MRILYTGSGLPSAISHCRPAVYQRYHVPANTLSRGLPSRNGSSGLYESTGPSPSLTNESPLSWLTAIPMAALNRTDSHLVHPE